MMILVGHPCPCVLDGMAAAFKARLGADDVVRATSRDECIELAATRHPSAAVVDVDVSPGGELELCDALRRHGVPAVMVIRSGTVNHLALLEAGAQGITPASDGLDGLLIAVRTVLQGNTYVPPHLLGIVLHGLIVQRRSLDVSAGRVDRLSPREREVLGLLGAGADYREIAARLVISPHTAKTHIHRLLGKLEVRSRIEAAALAVAHGVTAPDLEVVRD